MWEFAYTETRHKTMQLPKNACVQKKPPKWAKGVTGQFTSTDSIKHECQKYEASAGGRADGDSCCCKSLMVVWKPKK